jgi:hypothetical protein
VTHRSIHRQAGITVIGFLLLAAVFGLVGLGLLKIVPLYMEQMKIQTVLEDVQTEMASGGNTAAGIRNALNARFYVDYLELPAEEIEIKREGDGWLVHVLRQSSASFFSNLSFVLFIDEQVEITR